MPRMNARKRKPGGGRKPTLKAEHFNALREIITEHRQLTLAELADKLAEKTGLRVSTTTLRKGLRELGVTREGRGPSNAKTEVEAQPEVAEPQAEPKVQKVYRYHESHRFQGSECDYPSSLTDAEWEIVKDLFERPKGRGKPPKYPRRGMVDAMLYVVRGGISWRMMPSEFPPWHQVFKTFRRWAAAGRFEEMHDRLREMIRSRASRVNEPTAAVIDSQSVKSSPQGGPKGYDAGKKVKGRKRHLVVDTMGMLLAVLIHPANIQDRAGAVPVIAQAMEKYPSIQKVFADGGYTGPLPATLRASYPDLKLEIVRHPGNRKVRRMNLPGQMTLPLQTKLRAFVPLPIRWIVERTNAWNDRFRRMTKEHDRTILSSTAWVWLGEARILARRLIRDLIG